MIRGAVAETEFLARVVILPAPAVGVLGRAAADVIHLVAELIENAEAFSPSDSEVRVSASSAAGGLIIEIDDRGLGMPATEIDEANERIASPVDVTALDSTRLGLVTVGRLARRHDIRVTLRPSPYGGMSAVVLIPDQLLEWTASDAGDDEPAPADGGASRAWLRAARRGLGKLVEHDFGAVAAAPTGPAYGGAPDDGWQEPAAAFPAHTYEDVPITRQSDMSSVPHFHQPLPPAEPETIDGVPRRVPQQSLARELQRESEEGQSGRVLDWGGSAGEAAPSRVRPSWAYEDNAPGQGHQVLRDPGTPAGVSRHPRSPAAGRRRLRVARAAEHRRCQPAGLRPLDDVLAPGGSRSRSRRRRTESPLLPRGRPRFPTSAC
ncbi:MAG: sensor histidine kinase [Streptomyces sp.]|uniref:sensor histidine kinase n=1 Tax=Streptomyces sp. TaxID=1931 RepID=UPI0025EEF734|nr:sensor histidine kinase [Streptomyces sp.]MBW8797574.1 sensor histidine kinase [Streptomyces sp.]